MCPNKFIWSNSSGLVIETIFLDLKEDLVYLLSWQALQILFFSKSILDKLFTKWSLINLANESMLAWPNLLCHNQLSSSIDAKYKSDHQ